MEHLMIVHHVHAEARSKFFFQISAGVGKNRPNNKEDVAIVQCMLSVVQSIYISRANPVTMDGIAGSLTIAAITEFQTFLRNQNMAPGLVPDGAVDPAIAPIGARRVISTLGHLNLRASMHIFHWPDIRKETAFLAGKVGFPRLFEG